jgi:integrase
VRGHVRRRGKSWAFVVDVGHDESGRRRQQWRGGFDTRREAEQALTEALGRLQKGTYVEPSKLTVAAFMGQWLDSIRASVRPSTWAAYAALTRTHIIPALGTIRLQQLTAAQLNRLYADLLEKGRRDGQGGLSPRTVAYVHATVRKALAEAVRWQLLTRNVAAQATPPRQQPNGDLRTWSAEELRAFLAHVEGDRLYAAYLLASTSGLRRGELLGLRWRDLDLSGGRLSVTQTLVSVNYAVTFSSPKTAKGRRSVALDPATVAALRAHRVAMLEERLSLGLGAPTDDGLVFTALDGEPLHPAQFSDRFDRLVKAAGVPRIRLHDLRHTHATLALQAGVHPKVVSERLGHSTVAMTLDIYSHAIPAMQEEAAAKVAALVFGG